MLCVFSLTTLSAALNSTRSVHLCSKMAASSEPDPKKACSSKLIGIHSGTFHCDEALACFMLKLLPEYKDARFDSFQCPVC